MIRLQKVIAAGGLASRRTAETMIRNGEVTVNGKVVRVLGTCVDPLTDHVKVNGRHVRPAEPETFVLLHKPVGYVTTMRDPHGRRTIADLLASVKMRVFPVGRLDYDAEGLLLLTNNGMVAQMCLHPRYHVPKTYLVKVSGLCTNEEIRALQDGVALDDGLTAPAVVRKSGKARVNSWIELTIHEGKKHQVKRMVEAVGHRVVRIKRIRFGPLVLGDLRVGTCRFATDAEANALRSLLRQPVGAAFHRPAVASRAPVSPRPMRPQSTVPPVRARKPAPPVRRASQASVAPRSERPQSTVPPVRARKPAPPVRRASRASVAPRSERPRNPMSPVRARKPAPPVRRASRASVAPRSERPRNPESPVRTRKPAPPARRVSPVPVVARPQNPVPPVHTRKPAPPARRNAGGGRHRPPSGRPSGTRQVVRGRRPHDRGRTR